MKNVALIVLTLLLLNGCSKKQETDSDADPNKLYEVKFTAKVFDQVVEPMGTMKLTSRNASSTTQNLSDLFPSLICFVYKEDGTYVTQRATDVLDIDGNFSDDKLKIDLKLPKGNYKIGFVGGLSPTNNTVNATSLFSEYSRTPLFSSDLVPISVDGDKIYDPIIMNRLSAKIQLIFTDKTPAEQVTVQIHGYMAGGIYPFKTILNESEIFYRMLMTDLYYPVNTSIPPQNIVAFPDFYSVPKNIRLEINIYNIHNVKLATKYIDNVVVKKNHITKLTGKLFDVLGSGDVNTSFFAKVEKEYSNEIIEQNF